MLKFAANLSFFWPNLPLIDKFFLAGKLGFKGVEYLFPYEYPASQLADCLEENQLTQVLFNLPPGDWNKGERGIASLPGRENEFRESVHHGLEYAQALGAGRVHAMAGLRDKSITFEEQTTVFQKNLSYGARIFGENGIDLLIEPINLGDMPDYFLSRTNQARKIIDELNNPHLKLQFDIYHCQTSEGSVTRRIKDLYSITGHYQIAGVPLRQEPSEGELNYTHIFETLESLQYSAWIGCEYNSKTTVEEGLGWIKAYKELRK